MVNPQCHVDAVADDEADRTEPHGEEVGSSEEYDRLVDHDEIALVYGHAVCGGIRVTLGHSVDSQEKNGETMHSQQKYRQGCNEFLSAVQPEQERRVGLAEYQNDQSDGCHRRTQVMQDVAALLNLCWILIRYRLVSLDHLGEVKVTAVFDRSENESRR